MLSAARSRIAGFLSILRLTAGWGVSGDRWLLCWIAAWMID
jgi:hypothetical protein